MISIGPPSVIRKVINTITGTAESWDEAVGGGGYNTHASGDFYHEGNAFDISGNNWIWRVQFFVMFLQWACNG